MFLIKKLFTLSTNRIVNMRFMFVKSTRCVMLQHSLQFQSLDPLLPLRHRLQSPVLYSASMVSHCRCNISLSFHDHFYPSSSCTNFQEENTWLQQLCTVFRSSGDQWRRQDPPFCFLSTPPG